MKPTLPAILSNKKTAKKLFLFFVMLSFAISAFGQAPAISSFSPAKGPVGTLITINGTNLGTPTSLTIGGVTALIINNTGTVLTGFVMPGAVTGPVTLVANGVTVTAGGNFTVTATFHPVTQQGVKLVSTGGIGEPELGQSVAVSADDNTAIVGSPGDNTSVGAAIVYTRSNGAWSAQSGKLIGTGSVGAGLQGTSVAISADGNTAIEGASYDNNQQGAAWIFIRIGGIWSQQGSKLVGTGGIATGEQGIRVSISADGNTAVVGSQAGIWVYTRSGVVWSQQGSQLVATGGVGSGNLGHSVAISADGNTIIAGGPGDNSSQGAAWVFIRSGNTWTQQSNKLVGTGNTGAAQQGTSVSISADGNTAMVGGSEDNSSQGAAWVFIRSGNTWTQQGSKLVGNDNIGPAGQGISVSLSADGNTAVIGGHTDNNNQGAMWVFTRSSGNTWSQRGGKLVGTDSQDAGPGVRQGFSVAVNADGSIALEGGYADHNFVGAAWVFTTGAANASLSTIKITPASTLTNTGTVGSTTIYTTSVVNATASVTVTPTAQDPTATIAVNGAAVTSGTASGPIALAEGANTTITTIVTAQDGVTTHTYSITVTRAPSADASLSNLVTGSGTLAPAFAAGITSYTANVTNATTGITVTPTSTDQNATITVNGTPVLSGTASANIAVANPINIVVKAQDGTTTKAYSIVINKQSNNALLSTIKLTPATTLTNTGTSGSTTTYTASVANATASVAVTPTAQQANATITVNGVAVTSRTASGPIALAEGGNTTITTVVTSQDGTVIRTYSITVTRPPSANASLSNLATSSGTLTPAFATNTTSYTANVTNATTGITVIPTGTDANAAITVNGVAVTSGTASANIALAAGANTINIAVKSQDGTTTKSYSIGVNRQSNNALLSTIKLTPATTLTNTGTSGSTTTYTASVVNAIPSVAVTPAAQQANATITVNGVAVTSGTASGPIALAEGANTTITTIVTSQDGTAIRTYSITVTRAPSVDASLSNLAISSGTLTPAFAAGTASYTATVTNATTAITVTPTSTDANAAIAVNGIAVTSGTASGSISLAIGANTITTVVTAQNGTITKTYSIVVTRPSNNALLSTIKLTPASALTNTGTSGTTTSYTTSVGNATTSVTVTAASADAKATIKVNGVAVPSGTASGSIALTVGANIITAVVTAQDGVTTHTYTITVTRAKSSNAALSTIKLTPASTLTNTGTSAGTTTYTTSVSNATTSVTVTSTTQDPTATIKVNGVVVASGTPSASIPLSVGLNIINTIVTAQDGTTARYSIDLTRASGPLMSLYQPVSVIQPIDNPTIANDGVMVHPGVSPNGDGINDFLIIDGIIAYPDNHLTIIDRSGSLIYQSKGYNNISKAFDGHSSLNGRMQQPGTYFYSLDYTADGQTKQKTGFILLKY